MAEEQGPPAEGGATEVQDSWDRIEAAMEDAAGHIKPMWVMYLTTGGGVDFDQLVHYQQISDILGEARDRIAELIGRQDEEPRDLGAYGRILHARIPVELQIERECLLRDFYEATVVWQEKCADWWAGQAGLAEIEKIRAEREAAAAEAAKPKRRSRKKSTAEAEQQPKPRRQRRRKGSGESQ